MRYSKQPTYVSIVGVCRETRKVVRIERRAGPDSQNAARLMELCGYIVRYEPARVMT